MKRIILSLLVLACTDLLKAQDMITKTDSSKIRAEVLEINPTQLKYKLFGYSDGPLITENKSQIAYVIFKNGVTERFTKETPAPKYYDPNAYNLDRVAVVPYHPEARIKKREALYTYKNYVGLNCIAILNTTVGFHYMRDVKKANLILDIPVAVGLGSPSITNSLYGGNYLDGTRTTRYQRMNYQVGLSPLFTPSMHTAVSFLIGPSYLFTEYRMSVASVWNIRNQSQQQKVIFNNDFKLYRSYYGVNMGFMARYTPRFSMSILFTLGFIDDAYSEKDPYGIDMLKTNYQQEIELPYNANEMPYYVNFAWTLGYRF